MLSSICKVVLVILISAASLIWLGRVIHSTILLILKKTEYEKEETLGFPRGTIRTFLALVITIIVVLVILLDEFDPEVKKWVMGAYGAVISFYFLSKLRENTKK
jgi:uncharacterized BrkB/YihY/UPF0761 family membrane protein